MRAEGIVRVSRVRGREGDSFISPVEQADRITEWCQREGAVLNTIHEELDVSGGAELENRPGLTAALESLEAGNADVIVVAYFDRLFRSTKIQAQVLERIEKAGGRVFALDAGEVTGTDNGQWLQAGFLGLIADYQRRQLKGRMAESQVRAIDRGVATWDVRLPGYTKGPDGVLVPDQLAPVVRQAFLMRRDGATIAGVRDYLREHGIERSYHGVSCLLASRVYLGELRFGKLENLNAHPPIIDRDLWQAVQRTKISRGRKPKSDRLLARLGVLRCGTCGSRMTVGTVRDGNYPFYRCPPTGDCPRRQTISARIVESVVVAAVKQRIAHKRGRAQATERGQTLRANLETAQRNLDSAIRAFTGLEGETAAVERIRELTAIRDTAQQQVDHLRPDPFTNGYLDPTLDWDDMTQAARRALIKATVETVTVGPGRGPERVTVTFFE
jgi:DNA invertase Pin-like site-specific DNA recombinase